MRFSYNWLKELVDIPDSAQDFAEKITMAGLEVDSIEAAAAAFKHIVVGQIIDIQPHPDADRLRVCQVDVAETEVLTIVCGASNVTLDGKFPVALVGASLPGIKKLKASKLRGVKSFGMLCSAAELGLADEAEGLLPLPDKATNGQCVREFLGLDDACIDIDLTPNRGDCLSLTGLAREASTLYGIPMLPKKTDAITAQHNDTLAITLQQPEACPRYAGRIIHDINSRAKTPLWMQEKLRRSGLRSVNCVVDVTNYVLLELGQPMHAFDLSHIHQGIIVRSAQADETLQLLDGKNIDLKEGSLVIADQTSPLALAGIMGGLPSSVTDDTHSIFLEAAFFNPDAMAGQARRYGLHTDSSHRFERGVDARLPRRAIEHATQLLLDIAGGRAGPVTEKTSTSHLPERLPIPFRQKKLARQLGLAIPEGRVQQILDSLGFTVTRQDTAWQVLPPAFRFDVTIEADLIEEIARIYGYNNLPTHTQQLTVTPHNDNGTSPKDRCRHTLVERGYTEVVNYSFISRRLQRLFFPDAAVLALKNPISDALAVMRTSLWPGLCQALSFNLNRQHTRIKFIEAGQKFHTDKDGNIQELAVLAGIATGLRLPEQWSTLAEALDFFDIKADLMAALPTSDIAFIAAQQTCLHPGQSARIVARSDNDRALGWLGKIHPSLAHSLDIPEDTFLFECDLHALSLPDTCVFHELPRFPSVNRDLSVVVDQDTPAADLLACIENAAGQTLINTVIFDVYQGKGVAENKKSIAIRLTFQEFSRTLVEDEISPVINKIVKQLDVEHGAKLRDS